MHAAADSGCNENAQLMCERSNHGLCRLQRKSCHCGDARVMDVLLGLMHRWRWSGEPYIPVCPSVGRKLGELSAGDVPQEDFWPATTGLCSGPHIQSRRTSTCWALAVLLAAPCGNAPAPGSAGRDLDRGTRLISRVESGRPLLCRARDNCRAWRAAPLAPDPCRSL